MGSKISEDIEEIGERGSKVSENVGEQVRETVELLGY